MMYRGSVELDFFAMEKQQNSSSNSQFQKFLHRGGGASKIDPQLIKSLIASSSASGNGALLTGETSSPVPETSKTNLNMFLPQLPAYTSVVNRSDSDNSTETTAPLTIFYNGSVCVFDVTKDKAENIFKLAVEGNSTKNAEQQNQKIAISSSNGGEQPENLLESLNGDLPIARKKSLQRFLEKRKGRLTSVSPYGCHV